jgi:hypothetical protein
MNQKMRPQLQFLPRAWCNTAKVAGVPLNTGGAGTIFFAEKADETEFIFRLRFCRQS